MTHPPAPTAAVLARIRARLRAEIDERGIPIARLARRAGVSKSTVHRILDPQLEGDVYVGTLLALCLVLRLDIRDLFDPLPDEGGDPSA